MRGLFFIVKGRYSKGVEPSFLNKVKNEVSYIGGYDPYNEDTPEWYMLLDKNTFHCIACGGDFNKVLKGVYITIKKYRGVAKNYFRHISSITSDDYYETNYLGKTPLTHEQRVKKAEGRCPRVSPVMRELYQQVYNEFGDYFEEEIQEMEERAYSEISDQTPFKKAKKLRSMTKSIKTPVETPMKDVQETPKTTRLLTNLSKPRLGLKRL